nr:hypothetical protein [Pontibacter aydingkolensis]
MNLLFLHLVARERLSTATALDVMPQRQFLVFFDLGIAVRVLRLQPVYLQKHLTRDQRLVLTFHYFSIFQ